MIRQHKLVARNAAPLHSSPEAAPSVLAGPSDHPLRYCDSIRALLNIRDLDASAAALIAGALSDERK
jgi:hypothetical protein